MPDLRTNLIYITAFLFWVGVASAQPTVSKQPQKVETTAEVTSLKKLPGTEKFVSTDGGFSITLPRKVSGVIPVTQEDKLGFVGQYFQWVTEEAGVLISYSDFTRPDFAVETDQQYLNYFAGARNGFMRTRNAEILTEQFVMLYGHRGYAFTFLLPDEELSGFGRIFLVGKRGYTLLATVAGGSESEKLVLKAFESFRLLSDKGNSSTRETKN